MKESINHICPKCNFYIASSIEKHINSCDGKGPRRKRQRGPRGGWNKGVNYIEKFGKEWYEQFQSKLSEGVKKSYESGDRKPHDENLRRSRISEKMKEVGGGYRKGSGRGKKGFYKGYWCDSSWELAWVIYNLDHNIIFERSWDSFEYEYLGKIYKYFPDFKMDNTYVEIKGYLTEQAMCKINSFVGEIIVIDKEKIKPYLTYVVEKYGKNFTNLYSN